MEVVNRREGRKLAAKFRTMGVQPPSASAPDPVESEFSLIDRITSCLGMLGDIQKREPLYWVKILDFWTTNMLLNGSPGQS